MANLRCHTYFCTYNDCTHCDKEGLMVNDKSECSSFERRMDDNMMHEYASEGRLHMDKHHINCDACSCMNNFDHSCMANHVRFEVSKNKTMCMSYRKKMD